MVFAAVRAKYTGRIAATTLVANAELAQSYRHHARWARSRPGASCMGGAIAESWCIVPAYVPPAHQKPQMNTRIAVPADAPGLAELHMETLPGDRSEEHTPELQSSFGISYAAVCLNKDA